MRIGILAILHESNTFSSQPTTTQSFRDDLWLEGESVRVALADAHHEVGGFFEGLQQLNADGQIEVIPVLAVRALPAGTIVGPAWTELTETMLSKTRAAGRLDGMLLALHGAAVSETRCDADGDWLRALRVELGPEVIIIGTLDLHANVSRAMVESCNAWIAYRTNPHLDQRTRGRQAAEMLVRTLRGEISPTMSAAMPPLAINIQQQCTREFPLEGIYTFADQQLTQPGVLSNSLLLGFPYADVPEMGAVTIAVTDNEPALADRLAEHLARQLWENRHALNRPLISVDAALDRCEQMTDGSMCLLDMGDNVGGGSSADGTTLIQALHQRDMGPSFACLYDPTCVAECLTAGVGGTVNLRVGGKTDDLHGPPLEFSVRVRSVHDGLFREDRPRHGGIVEFDQGETVVVEVTPKLTLMITSRRMVPFSLQQLLSCDVDPRQFRFLVAKGVNAPIAAYQEVCQQFIRVNTIGSTCADLSQLTFAQRRRPMFPFEPEIAWRPGQESLARGFVSPRAST